MPERFAHGSDFIVQAFVDGGEEHVVSYHAYPRTGAWSPTSPDGRCARLRARMGSSAYVRITDEVEVRPGRNVLERSGSPVS